MFSTVQTAMEIFYLLDWQAKSGDAELIMTHLKTYEQHPEFLQSLIQFKHYINNQRILSVLGSSRMSTNEKKSLFLDAVIVKEKPEHAKLNQALDQLIKQKSPVHTCTDSFHAICNSAVNITVSLVNYLIEHPAETLLLGLAFGLALWPMASAEKTDKHVDASALSKEPIVLQDVTPEVDALSMTKAYFDVATAEGMTYPCEQKIKELQHDSPLKKWANHYKILVDPKLNEFESAHEHIDRASQECNLALRELLHEESLFPHLLTVLPLNILLAPENRLSGNSVGADGLFFPASNYIVIIYRREYTREHYKQVLRDEFFGHQVMEKNLQRGGLSPQKASDLFLFSNKSGKIDENKVNKMKHAIKQAKQSVAHYRELLLKKSLTEQESQKLQNLLGVVSTYTPKLYSMNTDELNEYVELRAFTKPDQQGRFQSTSFFAKHFPHLPSSYGQRKGDRITYSHCPDNITPRHIAACLIGDLISQMDAINRPDGPYVQKKEEHRLAEFANFYADLPVSIHKLLAPELYQNLCEFFAEDTKPRCKPVAQ